MGRRLRIAIYMRLSKGDRAVGKLSFEDQNPRAETVQTESAITEIPDAETSQEEISCEESNSIRMQRKLLREFAASHFRDYELLEFEDDGYSGTSFNRPGVKRLLEMVRNMETDCIIVKDFSRFSRDYIELGAYIEQIFPFMGVRFISVNDGYDSADQRYAAGELDISFKNLLYDLYSKDLSVKVKSALSVRKERGQYISSSSPFGYVKSDTDRHMLLIAEDEAAVVRRIFALALQGCSSGDIARIFNREGVKTPMQFRVEKGKTGQSPKKGIFIWQASTVCQILHNQVYVGDIVYGKTEKETVGGKNRLKPRSEWKIYADHHAPIIDRHTFQILQKEQGIMKNRSRQAQRPLPEEKAAAPSAGKNVPHPLTGKLVCGCCGRNLCLRKTSAPCFVCPYRYVNPQEGCVVKADALYLERYALSEMQAHVLQMEGEGNLEVRCRETAEAKREEWQKKRQRLQREETLLKKQRVEIYEAYSAGGMEPNAGQTVRENFADRENLLKVRLAEAEKKEMTIKINIAEAEEKIAFWGKLINREAETAGMMSCLGLTELTRQNVSELIDRIVVYGGGNIETQKNETEKAAVIKAGLEKTGIQKTGIQKIEIQWIEWERVKLFRHLCDTGGN